MSWDGGILAPAPIPDRVGVTGDLRDADRVFIE